MLRGILGAVIGLILGAAIGALCVYLCYPPDLSPPASAWTTYPTLSSVTPPPGQVGVVFGQQLVSVPEFRYWLFFGLLWGGGFGMLTGAVLGTGSAILRAIKQYAKKDG